MPDVNPRALLRLYNTESRRPGLSFQGAVGYTLLTKSALCLRGERGLHPWLTPAEILENICRLHSERRVGVSIIRRSTWDEIRRALGSNGLKTTFNEFGLKLLPATHNNNWAVWGSGARVFPASIGDVMVSVPNGEPQSALDLINQDDMRSRYRRDKNHEVSTGALRDNNGQIRSTLRESIRRADELETEALRQALPPRQRRQLRQLTG